MNSKTLALFCVTVLFSASLVHARGRRPDDDDTDKFPDYNRLEMHPKPKDPEPVVPPPGDPTPRALPSRPSLNTPLNALPSDVDQAPKPPPVAVPVSKDASEPPMPDDIIGALIPSATPQTPPDVSR